MNIRHWIYLVVLLPLLGTAHGAAIDWTLSNVSGDDDVATAGVTVGAFNIGVPGVTETTVNGVTFSPFAFSGTSSTVGNFEFTTLFDFSGSNTGAGSASTPFSGLSSSYQTLLQSFGAGPFALTLAISGLMPGSSYLLQWWLNDSSVPATTTVNAESLNVVQLNSNPFTVIGGVGQYATGTFVADGTVQLIQFVSIDSGTPRLNALQLRNLTPIPEPSTYALMLAGLAAVAFVAGRRKRTAARRQ